MEYFPSTSTTREGRIVLKMSMSRSSVVPSINQNENQKNYAIPSAYAGNGSWRRVGPEDRIILTATLCTASKIESQNI